ncbi:pyruvate dehydrogenase E2 component (dihydrolipoamide acetyltransferase) [Novosphingobium sp. SG751A]|nr:pyruvate dehydrogenase E2 component (dihydrolipoamide acetyltransferase) [Novosphingobium sp. SG751A]
MTEGTLADWKVAEGDAFTRGQLLCLIETAKITNEVEAEYDAVLARVLVPAGSEAQVVGTLLAVTAQAGTNAEEIDAFIAAFRPANAPVNPGATAQDNPAPATTSTPAPRPIQTNRAISPEALKLAEASGLDIEPIEGSGRNGRITLQDVQQALNAPANPVLSGALAVAAEDGKAFASPLARRIAAQHGIDLSGVIGTGPRGRISKADVLALVQQPAPAPSAAFVAVPNPPAIIPFDRMRKVVAQRLTQAKHEIPHFYLRSSARLDELLALRKTANLVLGAKASINDYLVRAAALALAQHPEVNVQVHGQTIHRFAHADIAIAVASPNGLVTPIVRLANRQTIAQIAQATSGLIDKAKAGRLSLGDMEGGTFSISNLGMFGVEEFAAIINPPQAAILAVGAAARAPYEKPDGSVGFETRLALTLSVDHRAIDGAAAAQFFSTLKGLIEAPEALFA